MAKFCNTVVTATSILMSILVPLVLVTLQSSETNTKSTKIGIKINVATTTVLQNIATVLNFVLAYLTSARKHNQISKTRFSTSARIETEQHIFRNNLHRIKFELIKIINLKSSRRQCQMTHLKCHES